jgi:hypothetical protein
MIGIATVIVLAIVFSGSATAPTKPSASLPSLTVSTPSKREIDSYAAALNQAEQQAKLAEAQAARSKEMFRQVNAQGGDPGTNAGMQGGIPGQALIGPDGKTYYPVNPTVAAPEKSAIVQEKEKMEFTSLFASPVALSLRAAAAAAAPPASPPISPIAPVAPPPVAAPPEVARPAKHILFEGTILEAVLTNASLDLSPVR